MLSDNRVSKFQRQIYDWLKELYPSFKIELEKLIPSTNQRIDIFIEQLELAIECDGGFHEKPTFFFVKTKEQWEDIIERDKRKEATLSQYGVDLIRIPYNHKLKSAQDLGGLIDTFYRERGSESSFDDTIFQKRENKALKQMKEKVKQRRREQYMRFKNAKD